MQEKLQKLEKKYNIDWREYRIEDVLDWQRNISEIDPQRLDGYSVSDEKKYPFYGQAILNNGIIEYLNLRSEFLNNKQAKPTILIHSNNQNIVYLDTPFYLKDGHGATSVLQANFLNKNIALYLMGAIKKVIIEKFSYNNKATKIALKNTLITLPTQNNKIAFDYIEEFLATLDAERLATLDAYLITTNLKDYTLTKKEREVLKKVESVKWGEFRNDSLFDVNPSKAYTGLNDDKILAEKGKTPYISNQSQNNGYIGWSNFKALNDENVITLSDTWQSERTIFYQPKAFIGKSHLQVMKPLMSEFEKYSAMFIISSFRKSILEMNYDYGTKFNREKIKATVIQLPIKSDFMPDFDFMSTYIRAMQKVVIKNVVEWADKRLAMTKEMVVRKIVSKKSRPTNNTGPKIK